MKKVCCICGKEFEGWGNNPWPVREDGECCSDCNGTFVIPARMSSRSLPVENLEKFAKGMSESSYEDLKKLFGIH